MEMNGSTKGKFILSTGNVLNVADLRKKAGQKPAEELIDAIEVTIKNSERTTLDNGVTQICMKDNDLHTKMKELTRDEIKIGAKVFLNDFSKERLREAIDTALRILDITCLNSLVLAYHPKTKLTNGESSVHEPEINSEGVIHWGDGTGKCFKDLKELWTVLEEYVDQQKICLLGVSDINCETLKELFESAKHPPSITQINLSACCVVPQDLKDFCTEKEIQLLTHSDPQEIITKQNLAGLNFALTPTCTLRYQVHIKCRGVLQAKGFILSAETQ